MHDTNLHDCTIEGILWDKANEKLTVWARSEAGTACSIVFTDVFEWIFSPFEMQNVIFSLKKYSALPRWITEEYAIDFVVPPDLFTYLIDSSCGMGGVVFAKNMRVHHAQP